MPPTIFVEEELYAIVGNEFLETEPEADTIKNITSVHKWTDLPTKEGEINFPGSGKKYVKINDKIFILINSKWTKFEKRVFD